MYQLPSLSLFTLLSKSFNFCELGLIVLQEYKVGLVSFVKIKMILCSFCLKVKSFNPCVCVPLDGKCHMFGLFSLPKRYISNDLFKR